MRPLSQDDLTNPEKEVYGKSNKPGLVISRLYVIC